MALSGGGMRGLAHVGGLIALEKHGLLKSVKEYVGTSAGALVAFAIAIGYTLSELRSISILFNFSLTQNLDPDNIFEFIEKCGLDDGANLNKFITILLRMKGFADATTFEELYAVPTGAAVRPNLRVYAVDLSNCLHVEFSLKKTPTIELRRAVAASMTIPFLFVPVEDPASGTKYVDGAVVAQFPFHHLSLDEREETIGLAFDDADITPSASDTPIVSFIFKIYNSIYHHQNEALKEGWRHRIIYIPCGKFPALSFDASEEEKMTLITAGEEAVTAFIRKGANRRPPRRKSSP
jgi:NTE family protein